MTLMLASVSCLSEAQAIIDGGADWCDIKDPSSGALGAASAQTVRSIVELINGQLPVSATIGDCWDQPESIPGRVATMSSTGVDYIKVGIDFARYPRQTLAAISESLAFKVPIIAVCLAESPPLLTQLDGLADAGLYGLMLDTGDKSAGSLLQVLARDYIGEFVTTTKRHHLIAGLAGRLTLDDIASLVGLNADYLGFRSALCEHSMREGVLSEQRVRLVKNQMSKLARQAPSQTSEVA